MEKRSDISRDSFRPEQGYTSVRLQQGRVHLDADWNEQQDIRAYEQEAVQAAYLGGARGSTPRPRGSGGARLRARVPR